MEQNATSGEVPVARLREVILDRPVCVAICETTDNGKVEVLSVPGTFRVFQAMEVKQVLAGFQLQGRIEVRYHDSTLLLRPSAPLATHERVICVLPPTFTGQFYATSVFADEPENRDAVKRLKAERSEKDMDHVQSWITAIQNKANAGTTAFYIEYHGDDLDKPAFQSLVLQRKQGDDKRPSWYPAVRIDAAQEEKLLAHLSKEGFLLRALSTVGKDISSPPHPSYVFKLNAGKGIELYEVVGWGPTMVDRLRGLRSVLDGDAAKELDLLLAQLSPLEGKQKDRTGQ